MGVDYEDCVFCYEDADSNTRIVTWRRFIAVGPSLEKGLLLDKKDFRFSTVLRDKKILARKELVDW